MAKIKQRKKAVDSYTICGTNKVVRVGDCVLIRPCLVDDAPSVGRVEKMEACGCGSVEALVRWYYRPENTKAGRRRFHGANELFLSDHLHTKSAHDIQGKCVVHSLDNYTKLDNAGPEDFFCRFDYTEATGSFTPQHVIKMYCKCVMPINPDVFMVKCDKCPDRFHPSCIGMTTEQARKVAHFVCSECINEENGSKELLNAHAASPFSEPKKINVTRAPSVVLDVPRDVAPVGDGEDDDVAKKGEKRKADTTRRPKKKKKKMNPMTRQVSHLIDVIASSKNKSDKVKDEIIEHLRQAVNAGAKEGSDEHFLATKLFIKQEYRAVFHSFETNEGRMAWLKRMCEDRQKN